jgi:hypothetical protein
MTDIKKIEAELRSLPEGWVVLLETSGEKLLEISLAVIKLLTGKNYNGIILSASRPYSNLTSLYTKNNIDTKKIFVLDCISKSQSRKQEKSGNVLYMENACDLTNILISINDYTKKIKGNKFVFIDSITTMLIYNQPNIFARFIHSVLTGMRMKGINGLLISLEEEKNKEVRAEIAQLCDKVLRI